MTKLYQTADEILQNIDENREGLEYLPTRFSRLDLHLDGGFLLKELVVIGGYTGIGKSYLAGQLMYRMATQGFKSAYFSLEISNEMVLCRISGAIANIKPANIHNGNLRPDELDAVERVNSELKVQSYNMFFYDNVYALDQIIKEVRTNKYEFIVIDFLQNVIALGADEYTRLSFAIVQLQKLAKEANCCILVLSQLSNAVARDVSKNILEYKGSGAIAAACDLGFVITKTERVDGYAIDKITLALRKNRRGRSGVEFKLEFRHPGGFITEFNPLKDPNIYDIH